MKSPFKLTITATSIDDLREQAEMIVELADVMERGVRMGSASIDVATMVLDRFSGGMMSYDFAEAALRTVMDCWPNGELFSVDTAI